MKEAMPFIDLNAQYQRLRLEIGTAIDRVLEHGQHIMGPEVLALEGRLAEVTGARHVVTCANGTDALVLALRACGVGPGDAVAVPDFTFVAPAEAVVLVGATPVFCDVDPGTFNLCAGSLEAAVSVAKEYGLRPRAVVAVDLFGQPADYQVLLPLAQRLGLTMICDAAQSFGSSLHERRVGTFGACTTTSFFPAKPFGCYGDGGAVLTDDDEIASTLASLRVHGKGQDKYHNIRVGTNSRLDTIQAAVLLCKLRLLDDELESRQGVASRYDDGLSGLCRLPQRLPGARSAWAQYTVATEQREAVAEQCRLAGVPTAVYYPLRLSDQPAYTHYPSAPGGTPAAERLCREVISLPMHPYLSPKDQARVIDAVRMALGNNSPRSTATQQA